MLPQGRRLTPREAADSLYRPPPGADNDGAVAQLGERLSGRQEVTGSIPVSSTNSLMPPSMAPKLFPALTLPRHGG